MAEKEYIERELAKKTFRNCKHTVKWLIESGAKTIGDSFAMLLDEVPAADVRPVVLAYWKSVPHKRARVCSRCEADEPYKFADDDANVYNFCPNCGADMRPPKEE